VALAATRSMTRARRRATLCAAALAPLLCACDHEPRQVSDSGRGAYEVSLATWSDGLAIGWYDTRDGNGEIYLHVLDADAREHGPELRLTRTPEQSYEADLAPLGDDIAVAWYEKAADGHLAAQLARYSRGGVRGWRVRLGERDTRNPVLRSFGGALFAAWIEAKDGGGENVRAAWWNADGTARGPATTLGAAGATTWNLNAAVADDGTAYVAYDAARADEPHELYLASLAHGQHRLTALRSTGTHSSRYPDIGLAGDRAAITWFDERDGNDEVYLAVGSRRDLDGAIMTHAQRVTMTPGDSIGAYLAWNGDKLGLVWSDNDVGNYEIYFQAFSADGRRQGTTRRLTSTSKESLIPAIRPWRGGFAIAWSEVVRGEHGFHGDDARSEVLVGFVP
jgi:hypothetical protein